VPRPVQQIPQIRSALAFYRVMAYVTGVLLLLVVVEMVAKYGFLMEIEAFGRSGLLGLVPDGTTTGVNLSRVVLIVHGWVYVVYLISNFRLFLLLRWPFLRLLAMAAGGVVPLLSFIVERRIHRIAEAELAALEQQAAAPSQ